METFVDDPKVAKRLGKRLGLEAARVFENLDPRPVEKRLNDVVKSGTAPSMKKFWLRQPLLG